jgi:hypothetical protein
MRKWSEMRGQNYSATKYVHPFDLRPLPPSHTSRVVKITETWKPSKVLPENEQLTNLDLDNSPIIISNPLPTSIRYLQRIILEVGCL